jgi:predicted kinase
VHLRVHRDFVWNATNISRTQRDAIIGLAAAYRARVEIVAVEAPADLMRTRNRDRDAVVPDSAVARMLARWEAPDLTEAHALTVV